MASELSKVYGKILTIAITQAMLFSTGFVFTDNAIATPLEVADNSTPPIPPFMLWGTIFDKFNVSVPDTTITITNLMTGESLFADVYGNGAYDAELEDLQQDYSIGDEIEITATVGDDTASEIIVVNQIGFGERVDIHFGNNINATSSENILSSEFESENESSELDLMADYERTSMPSSPRDSNENPHTIYIDSPVSTTQEPVPEISLTDIRCLPYFRLAFTEKENNIRMTMKNYGTEKRNVIVDLYHIEPDGITEIFLRTVHFGTILPGQTKSQDAWEKCVNMWTPTQKGRNWIRGEIYIKEFSYERILVNEFKESFNVVPGWRPVMHIEGDWIIDEPTTILNRTIVVDGDVYVNADTVLDAGTLLAGNLTVTASKTIGADEDIDLWCNYSGQFKVVVKSGAAFNIYGKLWNTPQQYHYWFYMNGTLKIGVDPLNPMAPPGIVENVMGSPDLSQPGGIICTTDNVRI